MTINEMAKKLGIDSEDLSEEIFDNGTLMILTPQMWEHAGAALATDFGEKDIKINWRRKKVDMSSWVNDESAVWFWEQYMEEIEYQFEYLQDMTPKDIYQEMKEAIKSAEKVIEGMLEKLEK
jgi:hypothetical protein